MTMPFGFWPKAGVRLPSALTLSTETTSHVPTKSAAVCAAAAPQPIMPAASMAAATAIALRGLIASSSGGGGAVRGHPVPGVLDRPPRRLRRVEAGDARPGIHALLPR